MAKFWYPIQLTWRLRSCFFLPSIHVGLVYGPFFNIEVSSIFRKLSEIQISSTPKDEEKKTWAMKKNLVV